MRVWDLLERTKVSEKDILQTTFKLLAFAPEPDVKTLAAAGSLVTGASKFPEYPSAALLGIKPYDYHTEYLARANSVEFLVEFQNALKSDENSPKYKVTKWFTSLYLNFSPESTPFQIATQVENKAAFISMFSGDLKIQLPFPDIVVLADEAVKLTVEDNNRPVEIGSLTVSPGMKEKLLALAANADTTMREVEGKLKLSIAAPAAPAPNGIDVTKAALRSLGLLASLVDDPELRRELVQAVTVANAVVSAVEITGNLNAALENDKISKETQQTATAVATFNYVALALQCLAAFTPATDPGAEATLKQIAELAKMIQQEFKIVNIKLDAMIDQLDGLQDAALNTQIAIGNLRGAFDDYRNRFDHFSQGVDGSLRSLAMMPLFYNASSCREMARAVKSGQKDLRPSLFNCLSELRTFAVVQSAQEPFSSIEAGVRDLSPSTHRPWHELLPWYRIMIAKRFGVMVSNEPISNPFLWRQAAEAFLGAIRDDYHEFDALRLAQVNEMISAGDALEGLLEEFQGFVEPHEGSDKSLAANENLARRNDLIRNYIELYTEGRAHFSAVVKTSLEQRLSVMAEKIVDGEKHFDKKLGPVQCKPGTLHQYGVAADYGWGPEWSKHIPSTYLSGGGLLIGDDLAPTDKLRFGELSVCMQSIDFLKTQQLRIKYAVSLGGHQLGAFDVLTYITGHGRGAFTFDAGSPGQTSYDAFLKFLDNEETRRHLHQMVVDELRIENNALRRAFSYVDSINPIFDGISQDPAVTKAAEDLDGRLASTRDLLWFSAPLTFSADSTINSLFVAPITSKLLGGSDLLLLARCFSQITDCERDPDLANILPDVKQILSDHEGFAKEFESGDLDALRVAKLSSVREAIGKSELRQVLPMVDETLVQLELMKVTGQAYLESLH